MQLNPYLFYNDNCEAAFKFYEKALGAKIEVLIRAEEAPADMKPSPGREKLIMHARMSIGGQLLMASDSPPEHFHKPQGFSVSIQIPELSRAERTFESLAESGPVVMPFQQTFFAARFGMLVDKFGTPWMVNCDWAP